MKEFTVEEVARHNKEKDCWVIIGREGAKKVYNMTPFLASHPGGPDLVISKAGEDVNELFEDIGHTTDALAQMEQYCVGVLKESKTTTRSTTAVEKPGAAGGDNVFFFACFLVIVAAFYYQMNKSTQETLL